MRILTVNAGSSNLKLALIDANDQVIAERELDALGAEPDADALRAALGAGLGDADAIAHRIVHGGDRYRHAVPIDAQVIDRLRALGELAPLHQPKSLAALGAVSDALPGLPAVACFDTAFHTTIPAAAATYALPERWRKRWGLRRFGFHGLSHAWVARRAPALSDRAGGGRRIVSCHLGAGASLCAIRDGRSVDTTMGFTPLEGLVMATRCGSIDPGLVVWLLERTGITTSALATALEHDSGILGLAGTPDMRTVLRRAADGQSAAVLARDVYLHRLRASIAAMAASLGGLDTLVFTGGVGERAPAIRAGAVEGLEFLGLALDAAANTRNPGDRTISPAGAPVEVLTIHAREDLEMVAQTRRALRLDEDVAP